MRSLAIAILLSCLSLTGCESWRKNVKPPNNSGPGLSQQGAPTAEKLVGYLNSQADRLTTLESSDISVVTHVQKQRMPGLVGFIAAEKPRNFRLQGDAAGSTWVDIGSNGDQFWFWVKDGDAPLYYCSYADYEKGVKLPMPFQPEWVVQALGMAQYDPNRQYSVKQNGNTYELIEDTTVQGEPVRKITIFAAGRLQDDSYPRVTGHVIQNAKTGKVICQATVKRVRWAKYRTAEGEQSVSYPSEVMLEWPAEQVSMTMKIDKATVNQRIPAEQAKGYFTLPNWQNIRKVDLARYVPTGMPTGREVRQTGGYR